MILGQVTARKRLDFRAVEHRERVLIDEYKRGVLQHELDCNRWLSGRIAFHFGSRAYLGRNVGMPNAVRRVLIHLWPNTMDASDEQIARDGMYWLERSLKIQSLTFVINALTRTQADGVRLPPRWRCNGDEPGLTRLFAAKSEWEGQRVGPAEGLSSQSHPRPFCDFPEVSLLGQCSQEPWPEIETLFSCSR